VPTFGEGRSCGKLFDIKDASSVRVAEGQV
jgi:hypothetical protein